jgi:hypothetical protein
MHVTFKICQALAPMFEDPLTIESSTQMGTRCTFLVESLELDSSALKDQINTSQLPRMDTPDNAINAHTVANTGGGGANSGTNGDGSTSS